MQQQQPLPQQLQYPLQYPHHQPHALQLRHMSAWCASADTVSLAAASDHSSSPLPTLRGPPLTVGSVVAGASFDCRHLYHAAYAPHAACDDSCLATRVTTGAMMLMHADAEGRRVAAESVTDRGSYHHHHQGKPPPATAHHKRSTSHQSGLMHS